MEFIKFFTSDMFRKQEFVDMLKYKCNVRACVADDGIILDREAFNDIKVGLLPHWAYLNKKFINSQFHTRPATYGEYQALTKPRYTLIAITTKENREIQQSDNLESMKEQAGVCAQVWRAVHELTAMYVVDNHTGEIMHEVKG